MEKIARYLDAAILKPETTQEEAKADIQLCIDHQTKTVCVRPCDIDLAVDMCKGTQTQVCTVLDFPHGCASAEAKEALAAVYAQKDILEIDMVMNYGYARSGKWAEIEDEIKRVVAQAHKQNVGVKVIFETCALTPDEIKRATEVSIAAGADFVKTSTGFAKHGATVEAVDIMLKTAQGRISVKPSGGIRTYEEARHYVEMGAKRLGVGSGSVVPICTGEGSSNSDY